MNFKLNTAIPICVSRNFREKFNEYVEEKQRLHR